jgi:hypothetical protein
MNVLIAMMILLQAVGTPMADATPITDGYLIVSEGAPEFPPLPKDIQPVTINADWELLYYQVVPTSSRYIVRGEIRNTSSNPLSTPTLIVSTANGLEFGIHPEIDRVDSGERAPFAYSIWDDGEMAALNESQELAFSAVCEQFYGVVPAQNLTWEFRDIEIEYDAPRAAARIEGTVVHGGQSNVEYIAPMLFTFNAEGHYIGSIYPYGFPMTLLPGDEVFFEMDHGFDTWSSSDPFNGAGRDAVFVLAMSWPTYVSVSCI